ncbi:MAG TPA: DNA-3-methyladenine glycosylase [Woeseiaceae bacterium]|nr:DNA-3-methyladenine glycosylase [Woeseiaceae bacterium]
MKKLLQEFYRRDDVVKVGRDLLGKVLCTNVGGNLTKAIITETEAYAGIGDRASHAYGGRRTARTEPMYADGGIAYVYLCYGMHHLFNIVTSTKDDPQAVLVRAGHPLVGIDTMYARRGKAANATNLLAGPGSLARALGIRTEMTGEDLLGDQIWIEDQSFSVPDEHISIGPRIGIDYAGEDASRPYRFAVPPAEHAVVF